MFTGVYMEAKHLFVDGTHRIITYFTMKTIEVLRCLPIFKELNNPDFFRVFGIGLNFSMKLAVKLNH